MTRDGKLMVRKLCCNFKFHHPLVLLSFLSIYLISFIIFSAHILMCVKRKSFSSRRKMESLSLYLISMITFSAFYLLSFIECCVENIDIVFTPFFIILSLQPSVSHNVISTVLLFSFLGR